MPTVYKAMSSSIVGPSTPRNPQNLTVTSVTASTVGLSWTAPVGGANTYNVYRNGVKVAAISGGSALSQTDTGLSPNTIYTYWVTGVNGFGEGSNSNTVFPQTSAPSGTLINFTPGFWFEAGNLGTYNGLNDFTTNMNGMLALDTAGYCKGFVVTFLLGQCEGAMNDYSAWFTNIQALLTYAQSKGKKLIPQINISGNVGSASVPGYMLNNATYGQVQSGTGYKGGLFSGPSAGPNSGTVNVVRYDIPATAARIAAACTALFNEFGNSIEGINPTCSEIEDFSGSVPQMTDNATINTFCNVGGMFDQIRDGCPTWYVMFSPSYMGTDVMAQLFACTDRNKISCGAYDFTNELPVRTSGAARAVPCEVGFRGLQLSGSTYSPVAGLIDRRANVAGGGRDFWGHIGPDELGQLTGGNVVPPARLGDGDLANAVFPQAQLMQVSKLLINCNHQTGPVCNSAGPQNYTPPANYAGATWSPSNVVEFFRTKTVPATNYPAFWNT